jgi:hypothetical protein
MMLESNCWDVRVTESNGYHSTSFLVGEVYGETDTTDWRCVGRLASSSSSTYICGVRELENNGYDFGVYWTCWRVTHMMLESNIFNFGEKRLKY